MKLIALLAQAITIDGSGKVAPVPGSGFAGGTIGGAITKGVNIFTFVIGAVSLIMILVGALRYSLSAGNPQATKEAKDTILYAVVGVALTILSLSIIRFVTGSF